MHSISFQTFLYWHLKYLLILENSVCYCYTSYEMTGQHFYDFSFKWTATTVIGIHPTKAGLSQLVNFKMQSDTLEERYTIKFCFKLGKMPRKRMECFLILLDHLAWIEHHFLCGITDSRKAGSIWGMRRDVRGVRKLIGKRIRVRVTMLRF